MDGVATSAARPVADCPPRLATGLHSRERARLQLEVDLCSPSNSLPFTLVGLEQVQEQAAMLGDPWVENADEGALEHMKAVLGACKDMASGEAHSASALHGSGVMAGTAPCSANIGCDQGSATVGAGGDCCGLDTSIGAERNIGAQASQRGEHLKIGKSPLRAWSRPGDAGVCAEVASALSAADNTTADEDGPRSQDQVQILMATPPLVATGAVEERKAVVALQQLLGRPSPSLSVACGRYQVAVGGGAAATPSSASVSTSVATPPFPPGNHSRTTGMREATGGAERKNKSRQSGSSPMPRTITPIGPIDNVSRGLIPSMPPAYPPHFPSFEAVSSVYWKAYPPEPCAALAARWPAPSHIDTHRVELEHALDSGIGRCAAWCRRHEEHGFQHAIDVSNPCGGSSTEGSALSSAGYRSSSGVRRQAGSVLDSDHGDRMNDVLLDATVSVFRIMLWLLASRRLEATTLNCRGSAGCAPDP
jgi:hypothetical protein